MYPIRQINPSLSTGLEKIVLKCTQKDPSLRYQSGEELFYALENYHKLDNEVIRKNKKKMSAFLCSSMLTIIFTFVSIFSFRNYAVAKSNTYESLIVKAESTQEEEAWINYQKAVEMKPAEAKAYLSILEKVSADNVITSDEDEWIAEVLESHKAQFKQENPAQYLKFAYNLGKVYWFGYENEANRIQLASQWFRDILDIDVEKLDFGDSIQDEANKTKWKQRAEIFCRIADNTGKLELSDYDLSGEGGFSYSGYLDDFNQLIQEFQPEENQNSADRVAILYIYKQLVAKMISKCKEFRNDNVTKEVLLKILNEIETNTKILSVDTTQAVQVLCDTLLGKSKEDTTSIVLAKQAVETNFK
jgi:serine/threonine-protein kinase